MKEKVTGLTKQEHGRSKVILHHGPSGCGKTRNILINGAAIWMESPFPLMVRMIDPHRDLQCYLDSNVDNLPDVFRKIAWNATFKGLPENLKDSILLIDDGKGLDFLKKFGSSIGPDWILCSVQTR